MPVPDILRTACEHMAMQITAQLPDVPSRKMLVTGGGAFNSFLVKLIKEKTKVQVIIPDHDTINYKEALIFAFLGVLRWREEANCLSSVTGAIRDNVGGAVYFCSTENQ